ncbi:hypothetical protein BC830DRAFT_1166368 [Chytriomyces sp. MP71]|nr:hypothetical protein BC830DRAFT_1166368 [Chytriomyces sp. MP71]
MRGARTAARAPFEEFAADDSNKENDGILLRRVGLAGPGGKKESGKAKPNKARAVLGSSRAGNTPLGSVAPNNTIFAHSLSRGLDHRASGIALSRFQSPGMSPVQPKRGGIEDSFATGFSFAFDRHRVAAEWVHPRNQPASDQERDVEKECEYQAPAPEDDDDLFGLLKADREIKLSHVDTGAPVLPPQAVQFTSSAANSKNARSTRRSSSPTISISTASSPLAPGQKRVETYVELVKKGRSGTYEGDDEVEFASGGSKSTRVKKETGKNQSKMGKVATKATTSLRPMRKRKAVVVEIEDESEKDGIQPFANQKIPRAVQDAKLTETVSEVASNSNQPILKENTEIGEIAEESKGEATKGNEDFAQVAPAAVIQDVRLCDSIIASQTHSQPVPTLPPADHVIPLTRADPSLQDTINELQQKNTHTLQPLHVDTEAPTLRVAAKKSGRKKAPALTEVDQNVTDPQAVTAATRKKARKETQGEEVRMEPRRSARTAKSRALTADE